MKMCSPLFLERSTRCRETKKGPSGKKSSRRMPTENKDKEKSSIICYECNKPGHFKFGCSNMEKSQDKKKFFKTREKKGLMST